jgi:hypothetical protein
MGQFYVMSSAETVNLLGRIMVAFYFLWAAWFNVKTKDHQLAELKRIGMPMRGTALVVGLILQLAGSLLLLYAHTIVVGGVMLIVLSPPTRCSTASGPIRTRSSRRPTGSSSMNTSRSQAESWA